MPQRIAATIALVSLLSIHLATSRACSLCSGMASVPTLREDATVAQLIVYGTLSNPRLNPAVPGSGQQAAMTWPSGESEPDALKEP